MANITQLTERNAARWGAARVERGAEFAKVARRLVAAKSRYQAIEKATGVPWFVVAVIHERESGQNWERSLAQGDPWNRVSTHVPAGRGPFKSFEDAAVDALVSCPPYAARNKDWSVGGALTLLERYNGLGYASGPAPSRGPNADKRFPPQPSPYIWSGTNQYVSGKYVADHDFRPEVVDVQLGCAGLILAMRQLDSSIWPEVKSAPVATGAKPAATVAVAGAAAGVAHTAGLSGSTTLLIAFAVIVAAGIVFAVMKSRK